MCRSSADHPFFLGQAVADTAVAVAMPAAQMGAGELAIANTVMRMPAKQLPRESSVAAVMTPGAFREMFPASRSRRGWTPRPARRARCR
jgi:hypothetical protein